MDSIQRMGKLIQVSQTVFLVHLKQCKRFYMSSVKPIEQTTSLGVAALSHQGQKSSSTTVCPPSGNMNISRSYRQLYYSSCRNMSCSKEQTPATHQPETSASGSFGSRLAQKSSKTVEDAQRDLSTFSGGASDKMQSYTLKTNLDHALSTNTEGELSTLSSRRVDPSLVKQVFYFDTLAFTKKLEASGFSREQAEGCAECLVEIINTTLDHQGRHMITKPQQEIAVQQLLSEILCVKKDMTLLQKSEFSSLKTETEKMSIELSQVQGHMNDEIVKLKGQFSLDINLERGRAIEAHAENEKKLQQLHNKIDTEVANLKTTFEVYRNDVFKYAGGTVLAVGTLMLGVIRLWT